MNELQVQRSTKWKLTAYLSQLQFNDEDGWNVLQPRPVTHVLSI